MSLLAHLGRELYAAASHDLATCRLHGVQVAVEICPCIAGHDAAPAHATTRGVYCQDHLARLEARDPTVDTELTTECLGCLQEAGILTGAS